MNPISISFEPTQQGGHTHLVVRAGPDGSRGKCGDLVMRNHEWALLKAIVDHDPMPEGMQLIVGQFTYPVDEPAVVIKSEDERAAELVALIDTVDDLRAVRDLEPVSFEVANALQRCIDRIEAVLPS